MILLIIKLIYFLIGIIGFIVFLKREDPVMMSASLFLLLAVNFFEIYHNRQMIKELRGENGNNN